LAERQRERAHDPQSVREAVDLRDVTCDQIGARRLEREDLDLVLRPHAAERCAVQRRAAAAAQLLVRELGYAIQLFDDSRAFEAAELDLEGRSRVAAAGTPELCSRLARALSA
jgi:hypothetical protein